MMPLSEENRRLVEAVYGRDSCSTILRMLSARGFTLDRLLNAARAEERAKAQALGGGRESSSASADSAASLASELTDQQRGAPLDEEPLRLRKWRAHTNIVEIEHTRDLSPVASEEARVHAAVKAYVAALESKDR